MKKAKANPTIPRTIEELKNVASDLTFRLGQIEYQVSVFQTDAKSLKEQLVVINQEGAERNRLDAEADKAVKNV